MPDCLVYWKLYRQHLEKWGEDALTPNWDTKYEYFFDLVKPGDNLWVIVRDKDKWILKQRIKIQEVVPNKEKGGWDIIGDKSRSEAFSDSQRDVAPILHKLDFDSGKKITKKGGWIGTQMQRPRPLSEADVNRLNKHAGTLKKI